MNPLQATSERPPNRAAVEHLSQDLLHPDARARSRPSERESRLKASARGLLITVVAMLVWGCDRTMTVYPGMTLRSVREESRHLVDDRATDTPRGAVALRTAWARYDHVVLEREGDPIAAFEDVEASLTVQGGIVTQVELRTQSESRQALYRYVQQLVQELETHGWVLPQGEGSIDHYLNPRRSDPIPLSTVGYRYIGSVTGPDHVIASFHVGENPPQERMWLDIIFAIASPATDAGTE